VDHVQLVPVGVSVIKGDGLVTERDTESRTGCETFFIRIDPIASSDGYHVVVPVLGPYVDLLYVVGPTSTVRKLGPRSITSMARPSLKVIGME